MDTQTSNTGLDTADNMSDEVETELLSQLDEDMSDEMALQDIYKAVTVNEDLILVIDRDSEEMLRKGLTAIKYKINKAAKDAGAGTGVDTRSLEFKVIPWSKTEEQAVEDVESKMKIQVYLKAKSSIRVHQMILTDKEF